MKTIEEVLANYSRYEVWPEDRFGVRLCNFLTPEQMVKIGFNLKDGVEHTPKEWTVENVLSQLKADAEFGLKKAEDERGISASMMYDVCSAWCDVLERPELILPAGDGYGQETFRNILNFIARHKGGIV